jgi:hypothetical protein
MTTPENKVKNACKKELKKRKIWFYMPVQNGMGVVGIPDIIGCWNGWFVGIETKAPGKLANVTPNQKNRLNEIEAAGGLALVIDNVEVLIQILDGIEKQKADMQQAVADQFAEKHVIADPPADPPLPEPNLIINPFG